MSLLLGSASKSGRVVKDTRGRHKFCPNKLRISPDRTFTSTIRQLSPEPFSEPTSSPTSLNAKSIWPTPKYAPFHRFIHTYFVTLTVDTSYQITHLKENIYVAHRPPQDWADWTALKMVRFLRRSTDFATGYKHHVTSPKLADEQNPQTKTKPHSMTEQKWLTRFVFLESVAGVPGMVAGMLRHLHSLRRLKKDNGW